MGQLAQPDESNDFQAVHVAVLHRSLREWTGRELLDPRLSARAAARALFFAPFAVVSHTPDPDPIFSYANAIALQLFEMTWAGFTTLPSRLSAESLVREERASLLARVASQGYIDDYSGVRISRSGRRFLIEQATVWNLMDEAGRGCGQAAMFSRWRSLSAETL
ncbi:MAG: MEKHLA domain-containing protein [Gammaproteobacteria bacterium]|nr:MEKHLA domain-containing protein [Gammaproteobacteria bacterium]MDJ0892505.1 MEKHLA domain-containing protein [Gammaproteobacteria bacterium]